MTVKVNLQERKFVWQYEDRVTSDKSKREVMSLFESAPIMATNCKNLYKVINAAICKRRYKFSTFSERGMRIFAIKESKGQKAECGRTEDKKPEAIGWSEANR